MKKWWTVAKEIQKHPKEQKVTRKVEREAGKAIKAIKGAGK